MNFKTTYFLFGLLVLMFVVLGVALFLGPTPPSGAGYVFPSLHASATKIDPNAFTRITIDRKQPAGEQIVLERVGDSNTWRITEPREMLADSMNVTNLLVNLHGAKFDTEAKPVSWRAAGLYTPSRIVTLEAGDRTFTLTIGEVTDGEDRALAFVESSERPGEVLVVRKGDIRSAVENLPHFRAKELLPDATDFDRLKLTQGSKPPLELKKSGSRWAYVTPAYGEAELGDLLTTLSNVRVAYTDDETNDFVADGEKDLSKYHLDSSKAEVLTIEGQVGNRTLKALIGVSKKEGEKLFATTLATPDAKSFDIVKVSAASVERFTQLVETPGLLRDKNLVHLEGSPDAIDIKNAYGLIEFRRPTIERDWELYRGETRSKVDLTEVRKLIDALNRKDQILSFPDPDKRKELGLDGPNVIEVTVWENSLEPTKADDHTTTKPTLRKDAKPAAVLRIGSRQGDGVAVERIWGDSRTLALAPRELLTIVDQRPLDYFDKSLPAFNPGSAEEGVTRVEITRDGTTYDLNRDKDGSWKLTQPEKYKNRNANEDVLRSLLGDLNRIRAREIIAEQADDKSLAEYGLEKPAVRVVVTRKADEKETTHTFDFGKPRGTGAVYARISGSPAVYVVDTSVYAATARDLRDPTVLRFAPGDVASVRFKGWQKILGSASTLTVERKDGSWSVTDKSDFPLDTAKVEELLQSLSRLQAEKFVPVGQGFGFSEGGFEITITLKDKQVLTLLVGAEQGSSVFAQSSELKGETVLIRSQPFTGPRGAPAYFSK
jgi:hypothetical protein